MVPQHNVTAVLYIINSKSCLICLYSVCYLDLWKLGVTEGLVGDKNKNKNYNQLMSVSVEVEK